MNMNATLNKNVETKDDLLMKLMKIEMHLLLLSACRPFAFSYRRR